MEKPGIKLLFVVGKDIDIYRYKVRSKKAPKWMKKGKDIYSEYINEDGSVPSDVAMAMYLQNKHTNCIVHCIEGDLIRPSSLKKLNAYDAVVVVWDAAEMFQNCSVEDCAKQATIFEKVMSKTSAFVMPNPWFHKYTLDKPKYYHDLQRANLPIVPFFGITPEKVLRDVEEFVKKINRNGWKGVIVKPNYSGYSTGIRVFKNIKRTQISTIRSYFTKLKQDSYPMVMVQEFIESFSKNHELRTYWIQEEYACTVSSLPGKDLVSYKFDTFISEGGTVSDAPKSEIKKLGIEVLKALPKFKYKHPMIRIDFGCCRTDEKCPYSYFINEVETHACNLLPAYIDYPIVQKVADALYETAQRMRATRNRNKKPTMSKFKSKEEIRVPKGGSKKKNRKSKKKKSRRKNAQ